MRVDLDAKIRTSDGEHAGSVQRAVVDPDTDEVTDFVVNTGGLLGHDVLVPRSALESATNDGDALRLHLTKAELAQCPAYLPNRYIPPPPSWSMAGAYSSYPYTGFLWPAGYGSGQMFTAQPPAPMPSDAPSQEPTIDKGALVLDSAGDDIGVVDDIRFDESSGKLRGFVIRLGGGLRTMFGGGETAEVTAGQIDSVAEGVVSLRLAKDQLLHRVS